MIARELSNDRALFVTQEGHADLAAQFAAHWGNARFARLDPYDSMVFAAIYHDSQFRDVEAELPINMEKGWPHGHRTTPYSPKRLEALRQNIDWVEARDPFAGLIVSRHHTGLAQNRYGVVNSWQNVKGSTKPKRPLKPEMQELVQKLEERQQTLLKQFSAADPNTEARFKYNYHLFQVFDLLSLYFCCDGHGEDGMKTTTIGPIPLAYDSDETVDLHIQPVDQDTVQFEPYPFDIGTLKISIYGRVMHAAEGRSVEQARAEFFSAERECLAWSIV